MNKVYASFLIVFVLAVVSFGTWQLYLGNFEAAFSTLPFLVIVYFFVITHRK